MFNKDLENRIKSLEEEISNLRLDLNKLMNKEEKPDERKKKRNLTLNDILNGVNLEKEIYSSKEFAKATNRFEGTISQMCRDGRIPAKKIGRNYIIMVKDFENFKPIKKEIVKKDMKDETFYRLKYWGIINSAIEYSDDIVEFFRRTIPQENFALTKNGYTNLVEWGRLKKFGSNEFLLKNIDILFEYQENFKNLGNIVTGPILRK